MSCFIGDHLPPGPGQQKRVAAFIEEHVADDIPVRVLAGLVDLSPYHFARAFKRSFGVPPHRYHVGPAHRAGEGALARSLGHRGRAGGRLCRNKFVFCGLPQDNRRHAAGLSPDAGVAGVFNVSRAQARATHLEIMRGLDPRIHDERR